eukprot:2004417-Alexandrium_andersonii.AAC.1
MSASLVGSEMCIRDRAEGNASIRGLAALLGLGVFRTCGHIGSESLGKNAHHHDYLRVCVWLVLGTTGAFM